MAARVSKSAKADKRQARIAATQAVVKTLSNKVGEAKKSKAKFSWLGLLKGAARTAAELAPVVLPALLGKHGPTMAAVQVHQLNGGATPGIGPALASPASIQSQVGVYGVKGIYKDGRVIGMRLTGMDYVGDVVSAAGANKGDLLFELDLNPRGNGWSGTRVQRESALYERYKVHKLAGMYEPSCPATTEGQLIAYIDTDPDETFDVQGTPAVQRAAAHAGAEVGQVWQMICAGFCPDKDTQAFYADANGSDIRLVSPGVMRIIAATDLNAGTFGGLYVAYDIEFTVPQVEEAAYSGHYAHLNSSGTLSNNNPMGNGTWAAQVAAGGGANFMALYSTTNGVSTAVSTYYGLPVGTYDVVIQISGTTLGTQASSNYAVGPVGGTTYSLTFTATKLLTVATGSYILLELTVNEDTSENIARGWFSFNNASSATITYSKLTFLQKPAGLTAAPKMSLRDYETMTRNLVARIASLEEAMSTPVQSFSSSQLGVHRAGMYTLTQGPIP